MVRFWSTVRTAEELKQFADAEAEDVPTDGLMLHYVFDSSEDTDDRVIDHSPSANHARCVAGRRLTWLRNVLGLGVSRGADLQPNRASVVAARPLSGTPHTAEFWVRVARAARGRVGILAGCGH